MLPKTAVSLSMTVPASIVSNDGTEAPLKMAVSFICNPTRYVTPRCVTASAKLRSNTATCVNSDRVTKNGRIAAFDDTCRSIPPYMVVTADTASTDGDTQPTKNGRIAKFSDTAVFDGDKNLSHQ